MSNRNALPNGHQVDNRDEADQNQTINVTIYIFLVGITIVEQPTALGEQPIDERVINPQDLTNEEIDEAIQRPVDQPNTTIPALCWLILMLYVSIFYLYWPLFIIEFITYQLFPSNIPLRRPSSAFQSLNQHFVPPPYMFDPNRDAQAEGRTDHPSDDHMTLFGATQIVEPVPYGIQATVKAHDTNIPVGPDTTQYAEVMTNQENADTNEPNVRITTNEDNLPQTVVDNPTCNINPVGSTESQDDVYFSDSTDDEDRIMSSGSGVDGDDEDDDSSSNENNQTSLLNQPVTSIENPPGPAQNNCLLNQTNTIDEQPAATVLRRREPTEIETILTIQTDIVRQIIMPPAHPRTVNHIPKPINTILPNNETSDEENT